MNVFMYFCFALAQSLYLFCCFTVPVWTIFLEERIVKKSFTHCRLRVALFLLATLLLSFSLHAQSAAYDTYTVQPGETMLGIANRHGTTLEGLLKLNPGMNADYVQSGQTLHVPKGSNKTAAQRPAPTQEVSPRPARTPADPKQNTAVKHVENEVIPQQPKYITTYKEYKVKKKDTVYSLAKANGITVDELVTANPEMADKDYKLKKGKIIKIPVKQLAPTPKYKGLTTIKVAVLLPFTGKGIEHERSLEFYRGILMGIDELRKTGVNITISAYNEPSPEESIAQLVGKIMADAPHVLVGPLYPTHFADATDVSSRHTKVVVPFSSKVSQVNYRGNLYLLNTPSNFEAPMSAELLMKNFSKQYTLVMLRSNSGTKNKFSYELGGRLQAEGYKIIQVNANATGEQLLQALGNKKNAGYLVIPDDDSEETLKALLPKLAYLRSNLAGKQVAVLGYEAWIKLSEQGYRNRLSEVDAYLLASNYYFPYTSASIAFSNSYREWFHTSLLESQPRMAPLGYDFSRTFLGNVATYGLDYTNQSPLEGSLAAQPALQTDLRFTPVQGGGYVCRSMWLVHFKTDKSIVKIAAQ